MTGKRPTIDDIARLAGVSKATVSRVLNRKPDVDPGTRERILRLVEEQRFVPSAAATGLAGGRNHLIGVLVRSYTWAFVMEIMRAIADVLDQTTYEMVLYRMNDRFPEQEHSHAINRLLATKLTTGLLAIFPGQISEQLIPLAQQGSPLVMIDDEYQPDSKLWKGTHSSWITVDNCPAAYKAVRHLIGHGHRRIAHIQGKKTYLCTQERHQGYCQALEEAGIPLDDLLVYEGDFNLNSGRAAARAFFSLPDRLRPTAIFASSDLMAYGVYAAALEQGIKIPDDIAIVGFDDLVEATPEIPDLGLLHPSLTTIRQPFYEMGRYAIEALFVSLETIHTTGWQSRWSTSLIPLPSSVKVQHEIEGITRYLLPTELIVRASCGCHTYQPEGRGAW